MAALENVSLLPTAPAGDLAGIPQTNAANLRAPWPLSGVSTACPPTALGGATVKAESPVRPAGTPKQASEPFQRKFNRIERKGLRPEKNPHRPEFGNKAVRAEGKRAAESEPVTDLECIPTRLT